MKLRIATAMVFLLCSAAFAGTGRIWRAKQPVPNEYIVVLADQKMSNVAAVAANLTQIHGGKVLLSLQYGTKLFGLRATEAQAAALARSPLVQHVEENAYGYASATYTYTNDQNWHLDRIDTHNLYPTALNRSYTASSNGAPSFVYVLDNGVNGTHEQFEGRVEPGVAIGDQYPGDNPCGGMNMTSHYHGTMVASVIAGTTNGVAKSAKIIPVKVWNCDPNHQNGGYTTTLWWCWGTSWILQDCTNRNICHRSVVNASIRTDAPSTEMCPQVEGGEPTTNCIMAFEHNIQQLIANGVPVVASANNFRSAQCTETPARLGYGTYDPNALQIPENWWRIAPYRVITVGGTTDVSPNSKPDWRWIAPGFIEGSNYGPCVDIYAPAENYHRLATLGGSSAYWEVPASGTSFSAGLVSGVLARLRDRYPSKDPADLWQYLKATATVNGSCFNKLVETDSDDFAGCNKRLVYIGPTD